METEQERNATYYDDDADEPERESEDEASDTAVTEDQPALRQTEQALTGRASLFGEMMEDAHRSVRDFVETVGQKSEELIIQAEEEVRKTRLAMVETARTSVDELRETADELIREAEECLSELNRARTSLVASSDRLEQQIEALVSGDSAAATEFETGPADAPPRRFGLR